MTKEGLGACLVCLRTVGGYWRYVVIPTSRIEARVLCETQTLGPTELEECVVYVILYCNMFRKSDGITLVFIEAPSIRVEQDNRTSTYPDIILLLLAVAWL